MKKIACKLIDYGYDFDYESRGSSGETIQEHMLGIKITNYQGEVYFEHEGERETFEENEQTFEKLAAVVERLIVEDTSSF